jgi:hypothetical protein
MDLSLEDIRDYIGDGIRLILAVVSIIGFLAVVVAVMVNASTAPAAAVGWLIDEVVPWWIGPLQFLAVASPISAVIFLLFIKWIRAD